MKVKNLLKITALALFIALPLSCVEPEEPTELPPETQKGANTFGCLVNGELFVAQPHFSGFNVRNYVDAVYGSGANNYTYVEIYGSNKNGYVLFSIGNPETGRKFTPHRLVYSSNDNRFQVGNTEGVFLTKLDLENQIVSGTFEFEIPLLKDGEAIEDSTVKITKGRFDIKFR